MDNPDQGYTKKFTLALAILSLIIATALALANRYTHDQITVNARELRLRVIDTVMPLPHTNNFHDDYIEISDPGYTGSDDPVTVFRARQDDKPAGVVLYPVIARGYSGDIQLIIGIAFDGTLLGVRTIKHRETEGLGDQIDHKKSGWINQFTGRSLSSQPAEDWAVTAEGGKFDQVSGATITSRAVINAVRRALEFYGANRDRLYQ